MNLKILVNVLDSNDREIPSNINETIKFLELIVKSKITKVMKIENGESVLLGEFRFITENGKAYRYVDNDGIYEENLKLIAK
ncbi:MAG: hypothetical protein PHH98_01755 [Candidatus Gracilibacteria bacterium]|nr:hypothetical protein [Candidatus Gracilibacteria bacterium]